MANIILHHEGKFVIYSTNSDQVLTNPMTERQLRRFLVWEAIKTELSEMRQRIKRAKVKGTSAAIDDDLADTVFLNRAGKGNTQLSPEQFVQAYFINPPDAELPVGKDPDLEDE